MGIVALVLLAVTFLSLASFIVLVFVGLYRGLKNKKMNWKCYWIVMFVLLLVIVLSPVAFATLGGFALISLIL